MPRKARLLVPGALYHVMGRCLDQYTLFTDDADRNLFLALLEKYLSLTGTRCYAWTLMHNHYHLVLHIGDIELWEVMKPLNMRYAQYHAMKAGRRGPLFMDRFKSIATQDQNYVLELIRYVHLNPVRAGICKDLRSLEKYPWCGHAAIMGKTRRDFQDTQSVLRRFGRNDADARAAYCRFLLEGINQATNGDPLTDLVRKSNSGATSGEKASCWVIGDREFVTSALASSRGRRLRLSRFQREGGNLDSVLRLLRNYMTVDKQMLRERHRGGIHSEARKAFAFMASRIYHAPVAAIADYLNVSISAVSALSLAGREIVRNRQIVI